jgi:hypothetical protein
MRETEYELEEREVERIYCDECGSECTDDHEIEPKEVCPSCANDLTTYESIREITDYRQTPDKEPEIDMTIGDFLLATILWPVVVIMMFVSYFDGLDTPSREDWMTFMLISGASAIWTLLLAMLFLG